MSDFMTPEQRYKCMSSIKGKNTKPEMIVRRYLHAHGFRYGLHNKKLPGKPDIVLRKYKTVIFVHGCFWHGHDGCKFNRIPKSNTEYWAPKIKGNKERDIINQSLLFQKGWNVITIWECDLINKDKREDTLSKLIISLKKILLSSQKYYSQDNQVYIAAEPEHEY